MTHSDPPPSSSPSPAPGAKTSASRSRPSRTSLVIGTTLVSALFIALALAATEFVLRMMRPGPKVGSLVLDRELGWDRYPPTDPQVAATASSPDPPLRLLCMGDSFTHNTAWSRMLIDELNRRGIAVTGWEAGVSGYGQVQQALKLERILPELRPDLTVLLFYGWNDPRDNCPTPAIIYNPDMLDRPFLAESGAIEGPSRAGMALRDSELYRRLLEGPLFARSLDRTWRAMRLTGADPIAKADRRLVALYSDPKTWMPFYMPSQQGGAYVSRAWRDTERAMARIVEACAAHGSDLVVVGVDAPFTIDRDVFDAHVVTDPLYAPDDFDTGLPLARFSALAESLRVPEVRVAPALAEFARRSGGKIYDGDPGNLAGHFLREPQEVMVKLIADAIEVRLREKGERATPSAPAP